MEDKSEGIRTPYKVKNISERHLGVERRCESDEDYLGKAH